MRLILCPYEMENANIIKEYVETKFCSFGPNKQREISRLLFEICRREHVEHDQIILDFSTENLVTFASLKKYLLIRRFPRLSEKSKSIYATFPALEIDPKLKADISKREIRPKKIFIEEAVLNSGLAKRIKKKFPQAFYTTILSYREFIAGKKYDLADYNSRMDNFFLIKEKDNFVKHCPCSPKSVSCGYYNSNLIQGCAFECIYCFLQEYVNSPGIVIAANIEDFFDAFRRYNKDVRLGTGERTDSLVFDHITEFSPPIIDFFRNYPKTTFEFKTKSNNVNLLLTTKPADNIMVSWSINPQSIIDRNEFGTASLEERFAAADKCQQKGFKIGFHFDPILIMDNWEKQYQLLVNELFDRFKAKDILWISLGTLRLPMSLKKVIENRFPDNHALDEEMVLGYDNKLRYSKEARIEIYTKMLSWIRSRDRRVKVYLCMEDKDMCRVCQTLPQRF